MPASSLFSSWKVPAMMVPGKLGLSEVKVKVFALASAEAAGGAAGGLFGAEVVLATGAGAPEDSLPLPTTSMCAGTVTLIVEVKRLVPYPAMGNHSPE